MFKNFNLLEWLTRRRTSLYAKLEFELRCMACKHRFMRKLRRLYVDLNTYDERQLATRSTRHSEFIIPEEMVCPKCGAVDQSRLTASTYHHLTRMPLVANNGMPYPHTPIQCIRFSLRDGRSIHPLDAYAMLKERVAREPENQPLRLEYANLLRMLGRYDDSEAHYRQVLERDPMEPEAMLNVAIFYGQRQEKDEAVKYLFRLIETVEQSPHPDHALFAEAAEQIMDGTIQMDGIELTSPALFDVDQAYAGLDTIRTKRKDTY